MPSTETLPNPLTEYQQGYADAMTEAARIINTLYARRFHDPFAKLKDIDLLMLARQCKDAKDKPPLRPSTRKLVKIRTDAEP
jgi:hypothetical protein